MHPPPNTRAVKTAVVAGPDGTVLWDGWASGLKGQGKVREMEEDSCGHLWRGQPHLQKCTQTMHSLADGSTKDAPSH